MRWKPAPVLASGDLAFCDRRAYLCVWVGRWVGIRFERRAVWQKSSVDFPAPPVPHALTSRLRDCDGRAYLPWVVGHLTLRTNPPIISSNYTRELTVLNRDVTELATLARDVQAGVQMGVAADNAARRTMCPINVLRWCVGRWGRDSR